jgi:transcriptional regulator with XRE-family HTH domain
MKSNRKVSERVRGELAARRMTQHELADRLGWHQAYLSRRLTCAVPWTLSDVDEIADVFNLAPWQLLVDLIA